jgi:hypothetical protein
MLSTVAHADGGALRLERPAGPFIVSVFTAPEPLRVGRADVSVLVQRRGDGDLLLGATIRLRLRAPDGVEQTLLASHEMATNRLFQSAWVELPSPGRWQLEITVRHDADEASISCELPVDSPAPPLAAHWVPLALPPFLIVLFAWRQRLLSRRARRS